MKLRSTLIPGLAWLLLAVTTLGAVLTLTALNNDGAIGVGPVKFALAAGYDRKAESLLKGQPSLEALDASEALSRQALALYPYDNSAWLRLAYIDSLRPGGLSPRGVQALEMSYSLVGVDPSFSNWRLQFCLQHWLRLSPTLHKAADAEFEALAHSPIHQNPLAARLTGVTDPVGAVLAAYWLDRLKALRAEPAR